MKNMIITGTAKPIYNNGALSVNYNVWIWGQTDECHDITLITTLDNYVCGGYDYLIDVSRGFFCRYFNVSESNIITLDHLIMV